VTTRTPALAFTENDETAKTTESLPVTVQIDQKTGRWVVDGIEMILAPRHMLTNNLRAADQELGTDAAAALIREAGHRSAVAWCERQAAFHDMRHLDVVRHYLDQLTKRGWGQFEIETFDVAAGTGLLRLEHSALCDEEGQRTEPTCYMFAAWLEGALDFARSGQGLPTGAVFTETACRSSGDPYCRFDGRVIC